MENKRAPSQQLLFKLKVVVKTDLAFCPLTVWLNITDFSSCPTSPGKAASKSQNHRGWKGPREITQRNHLLEQVPYSRLHRKMPKQVLNISREEDSTASMGSLFQGSVWM